MDDAYEVDNRYPEVAEPYEKIRGGRRHGALDGVRDLAAARRASRLDRIKRGFWTSTAAVVTAAAVLLASPGGDSHAVEPVVTAPTQIETAPPETVTAPPETVTAEPETKPTETEPTETEAFVAPLLSIREAEFNGTDGTSLQYSYQIELNSAAQAELRAELTADNGALLGSDGPYLHSESGPSPVCTAALSWAERPAAVTLTLTASYLENGEEKTLTESRTLELPEEPFDAPTLTITEAAVNGTEVSPLSYRYAVELNSAETMEVAAVVTAENGASLGTDGPYPHADSEASPALSVVLSWSARPATVTLTLTGTYTEKGEEKTVTVKRTLEVPELPFIAPTIRITSARCDDMDPTIVVYSAVIQANSADPLTINVNASANGETKGTDGPIRVTGTQTWTDRTFRISEEEDDMVLTLTGTYVEKGVSKTIRASANIKESEVFEWPEVELNHVERGPGDLVRYGYYVVVNSGSGLKVRTQFLDAGGSVVYETGPTDVGSGGSFGVYSVHTGRRASSIRLIGEFAHLGKTYTVNGSDEIPDEVTFVEPDVEILSASTNNFLGGDPAKLSFRFRVTMGDAERLPLRLTVITDSGEDISPVWSQTFTANGSFDVTVPINVPEGETGMYMILSGFYTIEGEEHQAISTKTVTVPMASLRPLARGAAFSAGMGASYLKEKEEK